MRNIFHIFLMGLLILGSWPVGQSNAGKNDECSICQHVCCCPEMCAAKLAALQRKSNCDQSFARCKIGASPVTGLSVQQENGSVALPKMFVFQLLNSTPSSESRPLPSRSLLSIQSKYAAVPTPPPRLNSSIS